MGYLLVAAGLIASAASLVLRLRKSRDDERRQLLWIASSAVFLAVGVVVILAVPRIQGEEGTWLAGLPLRLAQVAVPLCVAVAVLRHRLLEIDLIVNRALLVALATGLAATGYVSLVVVVGSTVGGGAGGFWPSLIATALVAMAFQPLRRRVVRLADRLAFGAAAAPYEALAAFSRQLGDRPDPSALLPAMAEAAARAVNAARVAVSVHVEAAPDRVATWPPFGAGGAGAPSVVIPVVHRGTAGQHHRGAAGRTPVPSARPATARGPWRPSRDGLPQRPAHRRTLLPGGAAQHAHPRARPVARTVDQRRRRRTQPDRTCDRAAGDSASRAAARATPRAVAVRPSNRFQGARCHATRTAPHVHEHRPRSRSGRSHAGVFPAQLARSGLPTALASLLARPDSPDA